MLGGVRPGEKVSPTMVLPTARGTGPTLQCLKDLGSRTGLVCHALFGVSLPAQHPISGSLYLRPWAGQDSSSTKNSSWGTWGP